SPSVGAKNIAALNQPAKSERRDSRRPRLSRRVQLAWVFVCPSLHSRASGASPRRPKSPYCTVTLRFTDLSPAVEAVMVTFPVFGPVVYCAAAVPFEPVTTEVA